VTRLVLLATTSRVAAGLLSADAWLALRAGPVFAADLASPLVAALTAAGLSVEAITADQRPEALAGELVSATRRTGTATWLVGPSGDLELSRALTEAGAVSPGAEEPVEIELLAGNWGLPGDRLLDVITTVDRLRSPGGCPWDAQQDHESLAPYLLEEAYEAFQAIEDADSSALCDELGDVLFQVVFHARLATERPDGERWTIDDVAAGLVDKLTRRHPHVFSDTVVAGAAEVNANWESLKAAERGDASVVASVPLASPALTLAATLQRKAARAGVSVPSTAAQPTLTVAAERFNAAPSTESAGELLWAAVTAMRELDIDAEAALRARARAFRDDINRASAAERDDPA
jgi:XTP/dITP diphosphohydrolase